MKPGETIGKYKLVNRLGHGGMGEVWLAQASGYGGFEKQVVLKTLLPEYEEDPLFIDMLAHEARTCGRLHHPNLIEVFDFSRHGHVHLLAMEHVDGESLAHIVRTASARGWVIPAWFALRVAWECARGLECAHDSGVIHCDLSPSNVMITFAGVTKIVDFGVAHSSANGDRADRLKGKFSYMAPERFKELATDRRTDIYAMGVMLYLLFCGRLPFVAKDDAELIRLKQSRPLPPSEHAPIDPAIERVIMRALEPDPADRFQTAAELLAMLTPCMAGQLGTYGQLDASVFVTALFEGVQAKGSAPLPPIPPIPPAERNPDTRAITVRAPIVEIVDNDSAGIDIEVISDVVEAVDEADDVNETRRTHAVEDIADVHTPEPSRVQSLFGVERPTREATSVFGARAHRLRSSTPASGWAWPWPSSRKTD